MKNTINCKGRVIDLSTPKVMGILNVTPDSFHDGGQFTDVERAVKQTERMLIDGATFIDIGGQSTRPGAEQVGAEEEIKRTIPVIEAIVKEFSDVNISIDTYHAKVAKAAIAAGASIINDVSAGDDDEQMFPTVAELQVPYIIMHKQGTPQTMQQNPEYMDVVKEVINYFIAKTTQLNKLGVHDVIIDPGFGFGKTVEHNYSLLKHLTDFNIFSIPVLAGVSRKSMINKVLGTKPENALNGTSIANTMALLNGSKILRVHDVKEAMQAIKLYEAYTTAP